MPPTPAQIAAAAYDDAVAPWNPDDTGDDAYAAAMAAAYTAIAAGIAGGDSNAGILDAATRAARIALVITNPAARLAADADGQPGGDDYGDAYHDACHYPHMRHIAAAAVDSLPRLNPWNFAQAQAAAWTTIADWLLNTEEAEYHTLHPPEPNFDAAGLLTAARVAARQAVARHIAPNP